MHWDSSRPVPWQRLAKEWLIYVAIMSAILILVMRDRPAASILASLSISGPLYLGFGYISAKLGYRRKTLKEMRAETAKKSDSVGTDDSPAGPRPKPPPTRRTGGSTSSKPSSNRPTRGKRK